MNKKWDATATSIESSSSHSLTHSLTVLREAWNRVVRVEIGDSIYIQLWEGDSIFFWRLRDNDGGLPVFLVLFPIKTKEKFHARTLNRFTNNPAGFPTFNVHLSLQTQIMPVFRDLSEWFFRCLWQSSILGECESRCEPHVPRQSLTPPPPLFQWGAASNRKQSWSGNSYSTISIRLFRGGRIRRSFRHAHRNRQDETAVKKKVTVCRHPNRIRHISTCLSDQHHWASLRHIRTGENSYFSLLLKVCFLN